MGKPCIHIRRLSGGFAVRLYATLDPDLYRFVHRLWTLAPRSGTCDLERYLIGGAVSWLSLMVVAVARKHHGEAETLV